MDELYNYYKTL